MDNQITGDSDPLNLGKLNPVAIMLFSKFSSSDDSSSVMLFSAEVSSGSSAGVPGVVVLLFSSAEVSGGVICSSESGIDSLEFVAVRIMVAVCSSGSVDVVSAIWR